MLRFLRIRNLAVIESVDVEFEPGFNVLTGETGAGKSIVVEAVGLLLGARASSDLVRTGESQATIEAIFEHINTDDQITELVVRREITSQGRSRSFINGALATAAALRDLSQRLVELHGQHEHQALLDPATHLPLLDAHADLGRRPPPGQENVRLPLLFPGDQGGEEGCALGEELLVARLPFRVGDTDIDGNGVGRQTVARVWLRVGRHGWYISRVRHHLCLPRGPND